MSQTIRTLIAQLILETGPIQKNPSRIANWKPAKSELRRIAKETTRDELQYNAAQKILKSVGWDLQKYLGNGENGIVFMAENDSTGQRAAVKFTRGGVSEYDEYARVKTVRESLAPEFQKHMPEIYFVEDLRKQFKSEDRAGLVTMIGVELLQKLPKEVASRLFQPAGTSPVVMQDVLKDEEIIVEIFRTVAEKISSSALGKQVSKVIELARLFSLAESKVLQGKMPADMDFSHIRREVSTAGRDWADKKFALKANKLVIMIGAWCEYFAEELKVPNNLAHYFGTHVALIAVTALQSTAVGIGNPDDPDSKNWGHGIFSTLPGGQNIPGANSLGNALKAMASKGLSWRDLHDANVMMRPSTGDIVVSDFGNFLTV